jgi:hypothetical protein
MPRYFPFEEFREIELDGPTQLRYAISNFGRLISFTNYFEDGRIVKGSTRCDYRIFPYKVREDGKLRNKRFFFGKLVATYFIPKTSEDQVYVLHLDRDRANDHVSNLKWATREEMLEHSRQSPYVQAAHAERLKKIREGLFKKMTEDRVKILKRKLLDPNRKTRMKMLAKQFGVTEMQLCRIKRGENWGYVTVEPFEGVEED